MTVVPFRTRAAKQQNWQTITWLGKLTLADIPPIGRVAAVKDGTVIVEVADRWHVLEPAAARRIANAIAFAASAAEERCKHLDGRLLWVEKATNGERVLVAHDKHERWFRPSTLRAATHRGEARPEFMPRCDACLRSFAPGDVALRVADVGTWRDPNWNKVRLHPHCVVRRVLGEAVEGGGDQ